MSETKGTSKKYIKITTHINEKFNDISSADENK
jgi:hypothetical protein